MAEKKPVGLNAKLVQLAEILGAVKWQKDGVNAHQKYKYISEAQYKEEHGKAVRKVGLIFKFEILEREFVQNISASMHLTSIKVKMAYKDPETGEIEEYLSYGDGADSGDKGLYKAETGAYKYHVSNNFHVAEYNDPENDQEDTKPKKTTKKGVFKSGADQKQAKEENMKTSEFIDEKQLKTLQGLLDKYKTIDEAKWKVFTTANPDLTKLAKKSAQAIITNLTKAVGDK
jgi:hypothetical protein